MRVKEFGSEFHYPIGSEWNLKSKYKSFFSEEKFSFYSSGRSAFYSLLSYGIEEFNWRDLYIPSYYCHDVVTFIQNLKINIHYYTYNPFLDSHPDLRDVKDSEESVFVNVSYYGRDLADVSELESSVIIDDLTHKLIAVPFSSAKYCFASLRKELPVPMGGFCTSPSNLEIPKSEESARIESLGKEKLQAMVLKGKYLNGNDVIKDHYRRIFQDIELSLCNHDSIARMPKVAKDILQKLDVQKIIQAKRKNLKIALATLGQLPGMELHPFPNQSSGEFGLTILLDSKVRRDSFRSFLISRDIYPAILWPDQLEDRDIQIQNRTLFIHIDFRYSLNDILYLCKIIDSFGKKLAFIK